MTSNTYKPVARLRRPERHIRSSAPTFYAAFITLVSAAFAISLTFDLTASPLWQALFPFLNLCVILAMFLVTRPKPGVPVLTSDQGKLFSWLLVLAAAALISAWILAFTLQSSLPAWIVAALSLSATLLAHRLFKPTELGIDIVAQ